MCMVNGGMWHVYKEVSFHKILMPDNMISYKGMYMYILMMIMSCMFS